MEFLQTMQTVQDWHWFLLACVLLVAEVLGAGGFLIGIAVAALVMSAVSALAEGISWEWQLTWFAGMSVLFTVLYMQLFRGFNQATDSPLINDRAAQLIGTSVTVSERISNGQGSLQIGDTRWKVYCEGDIAAGASATVVGSDGMTLIIEAA